MVFSTLRYSALRSQKVVFAYFTSKQILPFDSIEGPDRLKVAVDDVYFVLLSF